MSNVFEYKNDLSQLSFSPEQKEAMTQRLLQAQAAQPKQETKPKRPRGLRRGAVAAVAAAACLTVAASATGVLALPSDVFAPVFGTAETEIIDQIGRPIGASDSSGGYTITADAIMGDAYNICVVYTIERNDGEALTFTPLDNGCLELNFESGLSTNISNPNSGSAGSAWFIDSDPGDNRIQYIEQLSYNTPLPTGSRVTARFGNLYSNEDGRYHTLVAEGNWTLHFELNYEDLSISIPLQADLEIAGYGATLDTLTISPVGYYLDYTLRISNKQLDEMAQSLATSNKLPWANLPVVLNLKDGTSRDLTNTSASAHDDTNYPDIAFCSKGTVFQEIIPLEDMESVTIDGVTFPIEAN